MPLVYVHGVANRLGAAYDAGAATRDALFRRYLLAGHRRTDGRHVTILNPYWGEFGGHLHWAGASLPLADVEVLGGDDAPFVELAAAAPALAPAADQDIRPEARILAAARASLPNAVDLLWGASALAASTQPEAQADADAAALAALAAPVHAYAIAHPHPAWLADVHTDQDFLTRLEREVEAFQAAAPRPTTAPPPPGAAGPAGTPPPADEWESLGIASAWQALRRGAARLGSAVVGRVGREASDRIRPALVPPLTQFLGDVFVYLHEQDEAASRIRGRVAGAIRDGAALAEPGDPLIIVAHSMGGNIVYDLLSDDLADVPVALLVTAGTQVSFFEELKLFRRSDPTVPAPGSGQKVPRPANVARWINVFDYADVLGFHLGGVIEDVEDHSYVTGSLLTAHSQYFLQPSFHERLAARLA